MEDCKELLPEYLYFIKGVVDTTDLALNVSREMIQHSPVMDKIRGVLTGKIIGWIQHLADSDKPKYLQFYRDFGTLLKTGVNSDFLNREKLIELLRYETSATKAGEMVSLKEYVARMKENQKEIYYLSGDGRTMIENNPNLEYFRKNGVEVLYLIDPIDAFIMPSIFDYDKKPLKAVDKEDVDLDLGEKKEEPAETELSKSLIGVFKNVLKDKVEDVRVSKRLVDSPVTLVTGKGIDRQTERMMRAMGRELPASKRIMEINIEHPVIKNLSGKHLANVPEETLKKYILHLFETAQLMDGDIPSRPDYVKRMFDIIEEATK
jgi:molecular chaperone HtpG